MRRLVNLLIGVVVLGLLVDTWLVEGLWTSVIVSSGSMAPALLGPHRAWRCVGCDREFACGLESHSAGAVAVCPNCGAENDPAEGVERRGDRVLVDRSAFLWRPPRRWEAVVFRCPEEFRTLCVKRVVGLPGESVEIRAGDVVVNGARAQKNFADARAMAIDVYDAPRTDRRWQSRSAGTWQPTVAGFLHSSPEQVPTSAEHGSPPVPTTDWLTYHHRQVFGRRDAGAILDAGPCDQDESRELTAVVDITLRCDMKADGQGDVALSARSGADEFLLRIDVATGQGTLEHNGQARASIAAPAHRLRNFAKLELMVADRRVQLAIDDRLVVDYDYQHSPGADEIEPTRPLDQPLAIGAGTAQVEIRKLQVLRDVYYISGSRGTAGTKFQLGPDEYFVLGDNSAHALDSRFWPSGGGLSGRLLVGRALAWSRP